ncbi:MAG: thioredoxin domain-containing protein, partial [Gammaproteobacteria bacterium]
DTIMGQLDTDNGGLGTAPKFPHTSSLESLLRYWRNTAHTAEPDTQALYAVALSLTRMAEGGLYDQLGGGFCRYCVDAHWEIPHFEKMLYDNGPLLALCAQMWLVSGDELYRRVANETADWVIRDMHKPGGAFFSTLDADSEGSEGKFYVWSPDEVRKLISAEEFAVLSAHFGLDQPANFEGHWHLRVHQPLADVAKARGINESAARPLLDSARSKLLAARDARIWPGRDEKIIASWNGLMIRGLAIAAGALQREELAAAAATAVDFIRTQMVVDNRLMAVHTDGQSRFPAYLDDHSFLLDAVLELLQARWDSGHLTFAIWLADRLLDGFEDPDHGGFFFTPTDHETLMHRSRPFADESMPSGNGIAARALNRLGHVLGETRYLAAAENTLRAGWSPLSEFPHGHATLLTALEEQLYPPTTVIIRGEGDTAREWAAQLAGLYAPRQLVLAIPNNAADLPGALRQRAPGDGTLAYLCQGTQCSAPLSSLEELATTLAATRPA